LPRKGTRTVQKGTKRTTARMAQGLMSGKGESEGKTARMKNESLRGRQARWFLPGKGFAQRRGSENKKKQKKGENPYIGKRGKNVRSKEGVLMTSFRRAHGATRR